MPTDPLARGHDARGQLGAFMVLVAGAVGLVVLTVVLLLGLSLLGGVVQGVGGQQAPANQTAQPAPVTGEAVGFEDTGGPAEITQVYRVRNSRGYAVNLTGAPDSQVQSQANFTVAGDDTWTVSTWAYVDSDAAGDDMTALSADGRVLTQYNGSRSEWSVWYYEEGARDSYRVNVSAPNQPAQWVRVSAWHNGTHLTVYRNTTQGEIVDTTSTGDLASADTSTGNWDGRLDETRTFDTAINDSDRAALVNAPIDPKPGRNRTARLMYDQGSGATTPIYFTDTSADLSNATWDSGLPATELAAGTDYELDQGAGTITALVGGAIDGAPVVFIGYEYAARDAVGELGATLTGAYTLLGSAALLIPAVAVLGALLGGIGVALRGDGSRTQSFGDNFRGR